MVDQAPPPDLNSPVVVEQAKKLVALKDFEACADDPARIQFLYDRIYQRPARPPEVQLGLDFVSQTPLTDKSSKVAAVAQPDSANERRFGPRAMAQQRRSERNQPANAPKKRAPLTGWQEYAHALLQANEASFVN